MLRGQGGQSHGESAEKRDSGRKLHVEVNLWRTGVWRRIVAWMEVWRKGVALMTMAMRAKFLFLIYHHMALVASHLLMSRSLCPSLGGTPPSPLIVLGQFAWETPLLEGGRQAFPALALRRARVCRVISGALGAAVCAQIPTGRRAPNSTPGHLRLLAADVRPKPCNPAGTWAVEEGRRTDRSPGAACRSICLLRPGCDNAFAGCPSSSSRKTRKRM